MNGLDAISKVSGISKPDMLKIFEEVKANSALLNSCSRHAFEPFQKYPSGMVKKYKCSNCGGTVDSLARSWYERGLEHGKL